MEHEYRWWLIDSYSSIIPTEYQNRKCIFLLPFIFCERRHLTLLAMQVMTCLAFLSPLNTSSFITASQIRWPLK